MSSLCNLTIFEYFINKYVYKIILVTNDVCVFEMFSCFKKKKKEKKKKKKFFIPIKLVSIFHWKLLYNFWLQHKLKFSQRDKVKKFITFTQTGEQTAIYCLTQNDWKLDLASDNYFQNPEAYYKEPKNSVDKKKLEILFSRYQGNILMYTFNSLFVLNKDFFHIICICYHLQQIQMNLTKLLRMV